MCNQALFECLALNLHCLRGDQRALTAVINHRIVSTRPSHRSVGSGTPWPSHVEHVFHQWFLIAKSLTQKKKSKISQFLNVVFKCKRTKRTLDQQASLLLVFQQRMSSDISPSLVNWMTSMMTMRLQVILEHMPITQEQIQAYIVPTQVRGPAGAAGKMTLSQKSRSLNRCV